MEAMDFLKVATMYRRATKQNRRITNYKDMKRTISHNVIRRTSGAAGGSKNVSVS